MVWTKQPSKITYWTKDIDYALFIDENGSETKLNSIFKLLTNGKNVDINDRYFTITGCIFKKEEYKHSVKQIDNLKRKYWANGNYYDSKEQKEKYVCFHSRDIRRHDGPFNDKLINHKEFVDELTEVLNNIDCTIISITIDLIEYLKQGYLHSVYETAFDFLLERYIYETMNNKKGIIMLEARGKNEDKELLNHIQSVLNTGRTRIKSKELKEKIKGVYFNPKWNVKYSHTFTGLEIADLFSYPIHQCIKYDKSNEAFEIVKFKLAKYPEYKNKGLKIFPEKK